MAEKQKAKKSTLGKALKLFALIFVILLVPVVLDQIEVDEESVRLVGRVAAGVTGLLFLYGIVTRLLKVLAFVIAVLVTLVVLMSEGELELPRIAELFSGSSSSSEK